MKDAVRLVSSTADKEGQAWAWYCIGRELQRVGRDIKSPKIFGQVVQKTEMAKLPPSDRSDAKWMFQNWKTILEWLEAKYGCQAFDPFLMLSGLNQSHPSAVRRLIRAWLTEHADATRVPADLAAAVQGAFEWAWKRSESTLELSRPSFDDESGIEFLAEQYDPFAGTAFGRYLFSWSDMAAVINDPTNVRGLHESVAEWILDMGESTSQAELAVDGSGRVHFVSDL